MGRRRWGEGPRPVNIGGTGRVRKQGQRRATDIEGRTDHGGNADGGRRLTGRLGETTALEYLLQMGYKLRERNWRCRYKEVDLIMEGKDGLHIVEVRTRREPVAVEPEQTVDLRKQHNLEAAACAYLRMTGESCQVHFDIAAVVLDGNGRTVSCRYIPDAFMPLHI